MPYSIKKPRDGVDSFFALNEINGREFVEMCTFSVQDIQQQLALKFSNEVFNNPNASFNWHASTFELLPDGNTYQTVFQAKVNGINIYYMLTLKACFNIVELVALDPENKFLNEMELDDIHVLDKGLYESYLGFDPKSASDPFRKPKLLLIDTVTKKLTKIIGSKLHFIYDKSSRKIIFYELSGDNYSDSVPDGRLYIDIYSIDTGKWDYKEYDVSFPYDNVTF